MRESLTRDELLALPASVDLVTAGRALGLGRTKAHELVRSGNWPTKVLRLGKAYRVPTAEILALLGITPGPTAEQHRPNQAAADGGAAA